MVMIFSSLNLQRFSEGQKAGWAKTKPLRIFVYCALGLTSVRHFCLLYTIMYLVYM